MAKTTEKEIGGSGHIFLRCFGFEFEAEGLGYMRIKRTAGQSPDQPSSIEDQRDIIDGEVVEDIDPAEILKLEKL